MHHPRSARLSLGVCPQFTAIDSQLTVREHLLIYGRLKGLHRGEELKHNVESLMYATSLHMYADRLASKLSGGNQRKLSLAIALIGMPLHSFLSLVGTDHVCVRQGTRLLSSSTNFRLELTRR